MSPLSFIVDVEEETGEYIIIVTCEMCDEYFGFVINTHMTQEDFNLYKNRILEKPRHRIVDIDHPL